MCDQSPARDQLFMVVALLHPTAEERAKGKRAEFIGSLAKPIIAMSTEEARMIFGRSLDKDIDTGRLQVYVRGF